MFSQLFGKKNNAITESDVNALYQRPASFTDWLPWLDYDQKSKTFTLEDGVSAGVMFELSGIPTEAKPDKYLNEIHINIQTCINHTIPQKDNPSVLQSFVQDENSLSSFFNELENYIPVENREEPLTQHFTAEFKEHIKNIANPNGYFVDHAVTGGEWSGKQRKVRVFLYRRISASKKSNEDIGIDPILEINEVATKFLTQMQASGIKARRCIDKDLYHWLTRWFNPAAEATNGDVDKLIDTLTFPDEEDKPFGYDFSSFLTLSQPVSDKENGVWWFDDIPYKSISIDAIRRKPTVGHLTGERRIGENLYAAFDKFPTGTILSICITIEPQDIIENKIVKIINASKGELAETISTERDANRALQLISDGDYLLPTVMTLFIRGDNVADLKRKVNESNALLLANGLHPIRESDEQLPLNTYIKQLPMNYEPAREQYEKKSRLVFSSDLAKILPFYGRSTGTGHPGLVFYNRGAEPLTFDPLNKLDRAKNAFGLVLGPPGSGKSALMVYILLQIVSIYKARIYIIEKGGSFKLYGDYCKHFGLSVNQVTLHPKYDISLPPFSDAFLMLEKEEAKKKLAEDYENESLEQSDQSDDDEEERDYLGEMELKARVMITGGDQKEEDKMTRADRLSIRKGIVNAALFKKNEIDKARKNNITLTERQQQVLTEDVVAAMNTLAAEPVLSETKRERIRDMADSMELYCSGTAGHFFNRPGKAWPEADVTILEMGLLANEGYEDQLALGFMGLMNQINGVVEREQYSDRPTFVLGDESHLITTNVLLAPFLVKIVKMWRKLGTWLWLATQNMEDFPDVAKKLLGMFEWWFAMVCPKEQIDQIARFKDLTEEQKSMLLAANKEPGKYTEGVVMADKVQALFRNVPPPLALALAMTEKHEKRERAKIMAEENCTELEAVFKIVEKMKNDKNHQALH